VTHFFWIAVYLLLIVPLIDNYWDRKFTEQIKHESSSVFNLKGDTRVLSPELRMLIYSQSSYS
jgi:hypothetical protein